MNYLKNQQIFLVTTSDKCIVWSTNTHAVNVSELCMSNAAVCLFSFLLFWFFQMNCHTYSKYSEIPRHRCCRNLNGLVAVWEFLQQL